MSLYLSNIILHQFSKNDQGEVTVNYRAEELPNNESSKSLVSELHRVFNAKPSKGFAAFQQESEFKVQLESFHKKEETFYHFSQFCAHKLSGEMAKYTFADEGILVLAKYQLLATDYIFIGLLSSSDSLKVTEGLDIGKTNYLDIGKMDIAVRIDLSNYISDPESNRYLSYIKGRMGKKVGDFFLDFLQAKEGMNAKEQNAILAQAVEDFCSDAKFDKQEAIEYQSQVADYCRGQIKSSEEIRLSDLSEELPMSDSGSSLLNYTQEQGYKLEESFPADRGVVRKLNKYIGAGGGINISFDSALLNEKVFYDPETDTLTMKGIPPNLKDQLT